MLRSLLALLLLANYLLVVGTGLAVSRPVAPAFSAAHPYQHNPHCQEQNYLRLDCFEQCNGPQHEVKTKLPPGAGLHFLAQLKGLDAHCSIPAVWAWPHGAAYSAEAAAPPIPAAVPVPAGFAGAQYQPPQQG